MLNAMDTDSYLRVLAQKFGVALSGVSAEPDLIAESIGRFSAHSPAQSKRRRTRRNFFDSLRCAEFANPEGRRHASTRGQPSLLRLDINEITRSFPDAADRLLLYTYLTYEAAASARAFRVYRETRPQLPRDLRRVSLCAVRPRDVRDGAPPERRRSRAWRASLLPPRHGACHAEHQGRAGRFPSTPPAT
jgi:hypothetical protein